MPVDSAGSIRDDLGDVGRLIQLIEDHMEKLALAGLVVDKGEEMKKVIARLKGRM